MKLLLIAAAIVLSSQAQACGHCREDRIAAVYDHALVTRTTKLHQKMLYLAWDGPVIRNAAVRRQLRAAVARLPGVTPGSVRVSLQPATIALAYQPVKTSREKIEATLLKQLSSMQVMVTALPD